MLLNKPRANGEYGTKEIPNSRIVGKIDVSTSRVNKEYSDCSAAIG